MVEMTTACEAHECFVRFTSILNKAEARFHCMHYRSQGLHGEPKVSVELNDKLGLNYVLFYQTGISLQNFLRFYLTEYLAI